MTQFFSDAFSGTTGQALSDYSASWVKHPSSATGILITNAGRLRVAAPSAFFYYNTATPPSADYAVSADLVCMSQVTGLSVGVCGRMSTTQNTCYFALYHADQGWKLFRIVDNTATQLGSTVADAYSVSTRKITLRMEGSTISVYRNAEATPLISVTDTNVTAAGYAGVRISGAAFAYTTGTHLDNFSADTLDGGETSLSAISIVSGTPVIGSPAITQNHAISAQTITAGSPVLGTPSIPTDGNHELTAIGVESAPPVLGTPTLTEIVGILGSEIPSTGEHGGSPVPNDFTVNPASRYSWEVITQPSAGVLEIFSDLTFTWDAAGVADGDYTWVYRLYENGVSVGTSTVDMHAGALVVVGITAGNPILGTPALTEHVAGEILPEGITAGSPILGSPALTQNHALSCAAIAAGAPVFGTPTLAQQHAMLAVGIVSGTPVLGSPILSDGTAPVYSSAPDGGGYRREIQNTIRPKQRNTIRL